MSAAPYSMRSGRESKGPPPSTDLLVCFPPRTHLALMPKPIYSPARPEPGTRRRHARRPSNRGIFAGGIGHASPLLRAGTNSRRHIDGSDSISEPTSPKVTCAGQIKIKSNKQPPPSSSCRNWQSVMEEIERLHNNRKKKKMKRHAAWAGALGFKKEVVQFLTCLRNIRFDFRCFGSFPTSVTTDDDEDDEYEDDDQSEDDKIRPTKEVTNDESLDDDDEADDDHQGSAKTVFSKWFMVLQEDDRGSKGYAANESSTVRTHNVLAGDEEEEEGEGEDSGPCAPPANALLLMRCRSAPLNKWLQEEKDEERKEKERLVVMTCGEDFSKLSNEVAKETWIVGAGMLSRSRSCRR